MQSSEYIITVLANPPARIFPSLDAGDETKNILLKLALHFDQTDGTNKTFIMQHKQNINIAQIKLVPLPTESVPPVSTLIPHFSKKTVKFSLPYINIPPEK